MSDKMTKVGVIKHISPVEEKATKGGKPYKALSCVVESTHTTNDGKDYTSSVVLEMFKMEDGMKFVDQFMENNRVGDTVRAEYTTKASEYKGKWYNKLSLWRIETLSQPDGVANDSSDTSDALPF
tara:strand:- start:531 stop:905 length:375 start_codon:yes stop_codon:yes gene_type:complete